MLNYLYQFIAGLLSIQTLGLKKANRFPFGKSQFTLQKDRFEVRSDLNRAIDKQKTK